MNLYEMLSDQEKAYVDSLIKIREQYGPLDLGTSSIWVGYEPPDQNEVANIGVKCGNCAFHYELNDGSQNLGCKLVSFQVQEEAKCRLAAIPDGIVNDDNNQEMNNNDDEMMMLHNMNKAKDISVGDHVSFGVPKPPDSTQYAHGVVERVSRSGSVSVPGTNEKIEATSSNPVAIVRVWAIQQSGKLSRTDRKVAKPFSSLRVINTPIEDATVEMQKASATIESKLRLLAEKYNKGKEGDKRITVGTLRQVYNRGIGAYRTNPSSVRGTVSSAEQWAMGRVNAFLAGLRGRFPRKPFDLDLFPSGHPRSTKKSNWYGTPFDIEKSMHNEQMHTDQKEEMDKINLADIDLTPTDSMASNARRGLELRSQYGRGGTMVGVARARDLANKKTLSPETVARMYSFFSRHEVDKQGRGFNPGEDGYPSNGRIAWLLWGGDSGYTWAKSKWSQIQRARMSKQDSLWIDSPLSFKKNV